MVDIFYKVVGILVWAFGIGFLIENRQEVVNMVGQLGFVGAIVVWCVLAIPNFKKKGIHWLK